jgi:hypothetical protein
VSAKTAENRVRTEKIWTLQGLSGGRTFQVFHLKCDNIDRIYVKGMMKEGQKYILEKENKKMNLYSI